MSASPPPRLEKDVNGDVTSLFERPFLSVRVDVHRDELRMHLRAFFPVRVQTGHGVEDRLHLGTPHRSLHTTCTVLHHPTVVTDGGPVFLRVFLRRHCCFGFQGRRTSRGDSIAADDDALRGRRTRYVRITLTRQQVLVRVRLGIGRSVPRRASGSAARRFPSNVFFVVVAVVVVVVVVVVFHYRRKRFGRGGSSSLDVGVEQVQAILGCRRDGRHGYIVESLALRVA